MEQGEKLRPTTGQSLGLILLCAVLAHGLLLLNDVRVQDDWAFSAWLDGREWRVLWGVNAYANNPLFAYVYWAYTAFESAIATSRIVSLLIIAFSGSLVYLIALEIESRRHTEWLFVGLLSMTYPAFLLHWSLTLTAATFCLALFLFGVLLALRSERATGMSHAGFRIGALSVFFLSFTLNALLVFYSGFLILHFYRFLQGRDTGFIAGALLYLKKRADYVSVPIVFWSLKVAFGRLIDVNPDYNVISLSPSLVASGYASYAVSIFFQMKSVLVSWVFFGALAISLWCLRKQRMPYVSVGEPVLADIQLALFAIFLLVCGTAPYVLVGKFPNGDVDQWGTRLCLLVAIPMSILFVAVTRLVSRWLGSADRYAKAFLIATVVSGAAVYGLHYIKYESYSIETRSVMVNLAREPQARDVSVFGIISHVPSVHVTQSMHAWPYFFRLIYGGGLTRTAIVEYNPDPEISRKKVYSAEEIAALTSDWWSRLYGFDIPRDGRQATLVIEPGPNRNEYRDWQLVLRYFRHKWLTPEKLDDFLGGVTFVRLIPKGS